MSTQLSKKELAALLQSNYRPSVGKKITEYLFDGNNYVQIDFYEHTKNLLPKKPEKIEYVHQYGELSLIRYEQKIGLFEVKIKEDAYQIARNRVGLRDLINEILGQDSDMHAAIVIFYTDSQPQWRFTYVARMTNVLLYEEEETDPKRYTYVFGKDETVYTAVNQFEELAESSDRSLELIQEAFSVEKISKNFYKEYSALYERFTTHIQQSPDYVKLFQREEDAEEQTARRIKDFTKKILGRIVFLYFLQKKKWLGQGTDSRAPKWQEGNLSFMSDFFEQTSDKIHFHSKALYKLFFEALNTKRKDDRFQLEDKEVYIPYLNGGLFEDKEGISHKIDFPAELFQDLFECFNRYNFTVDESGPVDVEVGIDPEILGNVFERLLDDNKETGAFYTPKSIVHFMCQESLLHLLQSRVQEYFSDEDLKKIVREKNIPRKLRNRLTSEYVTVNRKKKTLGTYFEQTLQGLRICDPAIGSGAFPMGLLQELFEIRLLINSSQSPAVLKKDIIQRTIYGVDINTGAVDIARLRFWLSLVVDEPVPQPLPNLDYKIMQGNSLLESFHDIDLSKAHKKEGLAVNETRDLFSKQPNSDHPFIDLQKKFFESVNSDEKRAYQKALSTAVREYIIERHNNYQERLEQNIGSLERTLKSKSIEKKLKAQREKLRQSKERYKQLLREAEKDESNFFLWHLFFKPVFDEGGFDIVIGNPPYIQLHKMGKAATDLKNALAPKYKGYQRTGDIYQLFYELGLEYLLKPRGVLAYITGSAWMRSKYGTPLRKLFLQHRPLLLIDLSDSKVFEQATVLTSIMMVEKLKKPPKEIAPLRAIRFNRETKGVLNQLSSYVQANAVQVPNLSENTWVVLPKEAQRLKNRVEDMGVALDDSTWGLNINYGIKTGYNKAFILNAAEREEIIKKDPESAKIIHPMLRGRDVDDYVPDFQEQWLIGTHNGYDDTARIDIHDYPAIKEHLDEHKKRLEKRYDQGDTPYNLRHCGYWQEFQKPKIIYPNMTKFLPFSYDEEGYYTNQKCFIVTGHHLEYLVCFFNSKLFRFCFADNFPELQGSTKELSKFSFKEIPVKQIDKEGNTIFRRLLGYIISIKKQVKQEGAKSSNAFKVGWWKRIAELLVYEHYFGDRMHEQGYRIASHIQQLPDVWELATDQRRSVVEEQYQRLSNARHPLEKARSFIRSIEEVRVIEKP